MERWQWQVAEAMYAAEQGKKAEAVARLHRLELLFRKTGHVAAEITATGCRGLVQASMNNLGCTQALMRSVYLAQEQKQQQQQAEEEVAAAVADKCALQLSLVVVGMDKCALQLSLVVVGMEFEEAVGWFRLQRAPVVAVHRHRMFLIEKILLGRLGTHGRGRRLSGLLIHQAHLQVREAAREVMMMSTSIMDDTNHKPVCDVLSEYERVAEAAVKRQQLSRALDMLREALALGSSSSSVGPFLSVGARHGWHLWAWSREEAVRYRMGRLLVKLRPGNKIHLATALAMFATSLQCALRDHAEAADEECRLRRAKAAWWARLTIQALKGCPPPHFAEAATCSVLEELVGPSISRSQELMECLVEVVEVLVFSPPWQALVMDAVRTLLEFMSAACTYTLVEAAASVRRVQQVLSLLPAPPADERSPWPRTKLHAALLAHAGSLLHLCGPGHRDAALLTLSQAWDVLTASGCSSFDFITYNHATLATTVMMASSHIQQPLDKTLLLIETEMLDTGIRRGFSVLIVEYLRSGEEAAAALELDAAMNWYHKAADVARAFPSKQQAAMSHLSYRIGELQYKAGAWMEALQMLSDSLRQVLSMAADTADISMWHLLTAEVRGAATPGFVTKACRLVHRVRALLDGRAQVGDDWDLKQDAPDVIDEYLQIPGGPVNTVHQGDPDGTVTTSSKHTHTGTHQGMRPQLVSQVQVALGQALCALAKPEGIRWLEAARDALLLEVDGASGRAVALAGEELTIHGVNLYDLQKELAEAYSKLTHDGSKAAQMYEVCKDMATRLHNRVSMQLCAALEWAHAGDLLSAEEAVLEALDFLVPPDEQAASASEVMSMLWGSAATESSRFGLLAGAALLVKHMHVVKLIKAALVELYQEDEEWAVAKGLLDAMAPQLDLRGSQTCEARQLSHTGRRQVRADPKQDFQYFMPMRELFLLMAERQEGRGGDDDSWITDYVYDQEGRWVSLAMLVDRVESIHVGLGQYHKALLWAERGRMRLFMHRVHAQQHEEGHDPEWAMDSTPNDFDRDDGKALLMLHKVLLACGPNVALLEYSFSVNSRGVRVLRIYCLFRDPVAGHLDRTSCNVRLLPDCQDIQQLVNRARNSIVVTPAAGKKHRLALAKLHSLLVAPMLKELPDYCDTLIFVPDGCLSLVPFAALYDESAKQFLIEQKQVVVAPCLRALHRCLNLQDRFFSTADTQLQQPFVAGNPFPMGLGKAQLPHAQKEAAAVADILGVEPCLRAAVTKEAVLKGLGHSSVVVLATHAIVGPKFPAGALVLRGPSLTHDPDMASSSCSSRAISTSAASNYDLALFRDHDTMMDPDSDEPEAALLMRGQHASVTDKSQVLTADELSGMRIPAGLVVLSACETGRGEVTPEGVLGLGRALLQAGAATTVLSLWMVEDQATKRLITEMFQELQKGELVGTALRKAMLKMIQEGSSISHWAPFFIFGSPTMHLRNVTTLKAKNKMNGSSPEQELGDGMQ